MPAQRFETCKTSSCRIQHELSGQLSYIEAVQIPRAMQLTIGGAILGA